MDGQLIATFKSLKEAVEKTGVNQGNLSSVCSGKKPKAGGFKWEYVN